MTARSSSVPVHLAKSLFPIGCIVSAHFTMSPVIGSPSLMLRLLLRYDAVCAPSYALTYDARTYSALTYDAIGPTGSAAHCKRQMCYFAPVAKEVDRLFR